MTLPPKPLSRPDRVSLWQHFRLFRKDILSAQPDRLFGAKMAEFRTPFFRSFLINEPDLIREVLDARSRDFPKSNRIGAGLAPLLGKTSVFLTNGPQWEGQRRIIDPAFEGGRLRSTFPAMCAAVADARDNWKTGPQDIEPACSRLAADIIFRTLFSVPITDEIAGAVFDEFKAYQASAPILNPAAFVPGLPKWQRRRTRQSAARIRQLITALVDRHMAKMKAGTANDDLATRIMTQTDPQTGRNFDRQEMIDQVAIFFLAGHETSAAALSWALYLLATNPEAQQQVAAEAEAWDGAPEFSDFSKLAFTRDVFRETLRLYPPVPMMVRQATHHEQFRGRMVPARAQIVISPWHVHRHTRIWADPDAFLPERFAAPEGRAAMRDAFIPFSRGARVCVGAGFAMAEGVLCLTMLTKAFQFATVAGHKPVPRAHLTIRSANGIQLDVQPRSSSGNPSD